MSQLAPPIIVCAAVRFTYINCQGNEVELLIPAPRHFDQTMAAIVEAVLPPGVSPTINGGGISKRESGFIDQHGAFYDRAAAWVIAERNGQIRKDRFERMNFESGTLYSEHLY